MASCGACGGPLVDINAWCPACISAGPDDGPRQEDDDRVRVDALDEVADLLAAAGYRHDQGHGPPHPPEPGEVPGIVRDVLGRLARAEARAKRLTVIVRGLVDLGPSDTYGSCLLCGTDNGAPHEADCLWLRARQEMSDVG